MNVQRKLNTKEKALKINLNPSIYGSFSEIGAGQETATTFFQVGASSGTIAMTTSAYDMKISDNFYGESTRYVSKERLIQILEKDNDKIHSILKQKEDNTKLFSFANTIEALNFHKTNQGQGWLGIRFQLKPNGAINECLLHVKLHDNETLLQQKAVGRLGVNLIYACFYFNNDIDTFLKSLLDFVSTRRIEIDMFNIKGEDFNHLDNRLISLKLVKFGLTNAAMFGHYGENLQPSDILYKKNILVLRGRFRPPTLTYIDMLIASYKKFKKEKDVDPNKLIVLCELTLNNLLNSSKQIDEKDFLDRVDLLCSLKQIVLITNFPFYYKLVIYLSKINKGHKIGMILGIYNLSAIFEENYYLNLEGGILEALGKLFGRNLKLYVYPAINNEKNKELYTCDNFTPSNNLRLLFDYLIKNNKIQKVIPGNIDSLKIYSDKVLELIKKGDLNWTKFVPKKVVKFIKEKKLFHDL